MRTRIVVFTSAVLLCGTGCVTARATTAPAPSPRQELRFDPLVITGDLELEKLNDEELFATGSSAYAAADAAAAAGKEDEATHEYARAARYFGRLADFHAQSKHRRPALYNAGLALEKGKQWDEAYGRFAELADPKGTGDALDAAFRAAETLYHQEKFGDAAQILSAIAAREDLGVNRRIEAQVQQGVCELEGGEIETAEATFRRALTTVQGLADKDEVDDYFPGQAHFFMGEIYRMHSEGVTLDPDKGADALAKDLEYKAELLLSAQGHYLRAIRVGHPHWATAAGAQIGGLYEKLYAQLINSPAPRELAGEEVDIYRQELRKKIRVLLTKAINIYERTLETAERIGEANPFVERTRASLHRMKELLVADAQREEDEVKAHPRPAGKHGKPESKPAAKEPRT